MRILLVDDDDLSRGMMAEVLSDNFDHKIIECQNAKEAFKYYMANPCPIVITDIHMPGSSGLKLLRDIKTSQYGSNTDVIVITGLASMDNAIEALREGATDFLRKPIDFAHLIETIEGIVAIQINGKKSNIQLDQPASQKRQSNARANSKPSKVNADSGVATLNPGEIVIPHTGFDLKELALEIVLKTLDRFDGDQAKTALFLSLSSVELNAYIKQLK